MNYFAGLFISLFLPLGAPNRDLDNFIIGVTNRHNFYRRQHQNTPDLTGDRKLNADAQKYADHLCATSGFKHSTDRHGQGENLYASWSTTNNPKSFKNPNIGVDDWYNEGRDFGWKYGSGRGFSHNTGHFTQIVWASTTRLGVGRCVQRNYRRGGRSYSRMVLVARYSPAGNIRNRGNRLYDANVLPIGHSSSRPRPTTRTTHRPIGAGGFVGGQGGQGGHVGGIGQGSHVGGAGHGGQAGGAGIGGQGSCSSNADCPSSTPVCSEYGYCQCASYRPGGPECWDQGW